jgi:hypothetical protein
VLKIKLTSLPFFVDMVEESVLFSALGAVSIRVVLSFCTSSCVPSAF